MEGVVAQRGGELVGYLLGERLISPWMGRTGWLRLTGHAATDLELYRDLYAELAARWVADGIFDHYVMVAAGHRALLDVWFDLGFGKQQAYAFLPLTDYAPDFPVPSDIEVRRATPDDRDAVRSIGDTIARYQMGSPVFAPTPPEIIEEDIRNGMVELIEDDEWMLWLALKGGQVVGYQGYVVEEADDTNLLSIPGAVELSIAGTAAHARGLGVGRALTRHGLLHARDAGYAICLTDWRTTNLLSSRFWPRSGFVPVVYRLTRHIDPRITWAAR
ncbi:MAG: GNAT family N-acetyltransferase, partial [Chloroflexi bacterium]|nr:GNAT family N-acetyltransferase [Chloroflexota bacterium]